MFHDKKKKAEEPDREPITLQELLRKTAPPPQEVEGRPRCDIGIWGWEEVGKTHYLGSLWHEQQTLAEANIKLYWPPTAEGEKAKELAQLAEQKLYRQGEFLDRSVHDLVSYCFRLEVPTGYFPKGPRFVDILCPDISGTELREFQDGAMAPIYSAKGILVILDPKDLDEEWRLGDEAVRKRLKRQDDRFEPTQEDIRRNSAFGLLTDLLFKISDQEGPNEGRVSKYIAYCFAKIDQEPFWRDRDKPDLIARRYLTQLRILQQIETVVLEGHYKFFNFSVIGRIKNVSEHMYIDDTGKKKIKNTNEISQFGIYEPLTWLIDNISGIYL